MTAKKSIHRLILLALALVLSSCMGDAGRKGRPLIIDFSLGGLDDGKAHLCYDFYDPVDNICRTLGCPSGTHVADSSERSQLKSQLLQEKIDTNPLDEDALNLIDQILENFDIQNSLCAPGSGIKRPNRQVYIKNDYCACNNGIADILNNCAAFCSTKPNTNSQPILFGSVTLGPDVLLNEELGNLENWCNVALEGSEEVAPRCALRVFDGTNTTDLDINIPSDSNTFSVNIASLTPETPYVARIVEVQSGSNASSDEFQIYRIPQNNGAPGPVGPLKIMPISQYTCVQWAGTVGSNVSYNAMVKMYFYFPSNQEPLPIVNPTNGANINVYCHDLQLYGPTDNPLYPRLELIPQHLSLWDFSDTRLSDLNNNSNADINETIVTRLQTDYNVSNPNLKVFNLFPILSRPNAAQSSGGFFMVPWINPQTGRGFCPKQAHYNGNDPVFKILKDVVGVDTEGIYAAIKQPELITLPDNTTVSAPDTFLFIRENLLKQIWFYTENNQILIPNEITAGQKTIHFYWPADTQDPYTKKDYQKIFTIRGANDLGSGDGNALQIPTSVIPSDKRLGCIPALD
jgi:hypothetical protein